MKDRIREISSNCKGLPLAINAVVGAMNFKKTEDEWSLSIRPKKWQNRGHFP